MDKEVAKEIVELYMQEKHKFQLFMNGGKRKTSPRLA